MLVDTCSAGKLSQILASENQQAVFTPATKDTRFGTHQYAGFDLCGWTADGCFWAVETKIGRVRGANDGRLITLPLDHRSGLKDVVALLDGEIPVVHLDGHGTAPEIHLKGSGVFVQELLDPVEDHELYPLERWLAALVPPREGHEGRAFMAADEALKAFLSGMDQVVDEFITTWLGRKPDGCREAVTTALLEEWSERLDITDDAAVIRDLKARVARAAKNLKPLWELQANHGFIQLLDEPLTPTGDTLGDLLTDSTDTGIQALDNVTGLGSHQCLASILSLARLSPAERHVVDEFSKQTRSVSWQKAATELGYAPGFGRRIKRRLQYYGREHIRRALQFMAKHDCCRRPDSSIEATSPRSIS
ncbi:hypothetical protein [Streptomyces sp. NPDC046832]|uniref:hypothetical protein n=1 Tax=Streptomyces sp. NPDC046832 TaxID=3155020 RepID=UPI003411D50A